MNISLRKINAILVFKSKTILKNTQILALLFLALGMVILMKSVMPAEETLNGMNGASFILGCGLTFNSLSGMMMASHPLAEEKEKNTLRVLMTSSVNATEFFLGSILPSYFLVEATNLLMVPLSGISFKEIPLLAFFLLTSLLTVISLLIGLSVGMMSKTQMQAGLMLVPIMLILMMIPNFRSFNVWLGKISQFFYTGIVTKYLDQIFVQHQTNWHFLDIAVLATWLILSLALFRYGYKKHGLD